MNIKKKLLFVCVQNSCRSQICQAFTQLHARGSVQAYSAGSNPSGEVNPKAVASMAELGYDLSQHKSKSLSDVESHGPFDVIVTMGCGDSCPQIEAKKRVDWQIPDPRD